MKQVISVGELNQLLLTGKPDLKVIDVRFPEEFHKQHLAFAENLPASELGNAKEKGFELTDTIVCVCNKGHERSQRAADKLSEMGYQKVFYLDGGMVEWFEKAE